MQNLKDKYENLKRRAKKTEADRKKEVFKTGGGTARSTVAPSATHNVLKGMNSIEKIYKNVLLYFQ